MTVPNIFGTLTGSSPIEVPAAELDANFAAILGGTAGTYSGTINVATSALTPAFNTIQTASGTSAAFEIPLNTFEIASDVVNATGGSSDGFTQGFWFGIKGGGASRGGGVTLWADFNLTAPTSSSSSNRNYVAVSGISTAKSGDGGTNPTNVTAMELNTTVGAGASVWAKSLIQVSGAFNDAVKGDPDATSSAALISVR